MFIADVFRGRQLNFFNTYVSGFEALGGGNFAEKTKRLKTAFRGLKKGAQKTLLLSCVTAAYLLS